MADYEVAWELDFPVGKPEELLLALVVKDLLHGASFDVEVDEGGEIVEVDLYSGDELDESYRLLIAAEVQGADARETLQQFIESILEESVDEAADLVARGEQLDKMPLDRLVFEPVEEDAERWDLVIPDWLAPDGAEVPFGFRPYLREDGTPWPANALIDGHGRILAVPWKGELLLYGIPAPAAPAEEAGDCS